MPKARSFILAIDQGTSGTTALVFDRRGALRGRGHAEFPQYFPKPGWVEHDAQEIWTNGVGVARAALRDAKVQGAELAGLGITNQRETLVAWDSATLQPLARAIVWQCRRTASMCERLQGAGLEPALRAKTGLLLDPYFSGTKLRWMLENLPKVARARKARRLRFGTIDSWLVAKLTGGARHATDPSNASRTLLYNLRDDDWDDELLEVFSARRSELPEIVDSSGIVADADRRWFGATVPIAGIAGDQQAALFGQACFRAGSAKNTYGTGCFALVNAGSRVPKPTKGLLATVAWRRRGRLTYALEGSVFIGGAAVQWLRDGLAVISEASESERLASQVDSTDDLFLVPAFVGLGAPHWDPTARGILVGITRGTDRRHLARAALESIAHQSADVLDAMAGPPGRRIRHLKADGGAAANALLMQLQADLLGVPVQVPTTTETTAQGAAFLAGLGTGLWSSLKELEAIWKPARTYRPHLRPAARRVARARWSQAVERAKGWSTG